MGFMEIWSKYFKNFPSNRNTSFLVPNCLSKYYAQNRTPYIAISTLPVEFDTYPVFWFMLRLLIVIALLGLVGGLIYDFLGTKMLLPILLTE